MASPGRVQPPLRVAFLACSLDEGGTELHALRLASALPSIGIQPFLAHTPPSGPLLASYRDQGIPTAAFPVKRFRSGTFLTAARAFRAWLVREGIVVVHSQDLYANIAGAVWMAGLQTPLLASRRWEETPYARLLRLASRAASRRADAIVCNAPYLARHVHETQPSLAARSVVIPNLLEPQSFTPPPAHFRSQLRARLSLPQDALVAGVVARLDPLKGHDLLLKALAQVRARGVPLYLLVVGDGPTRSTLEALTCRLHLQEAVRFSGHLGRDPSPFHGCDLAVLSSHSEGSPNSLVEAMAAGVPVVATAVGGVPDLIVPGATGLLVPAGDVEALAGALTGLATSSTLRLALGAAAARAASDRHAPDTVLPRWAMLYRQMAERRPPGAGRS